MLAETKWDLPDLERQFDGITLEGIINVIEALKNNCRDSYKQDKRYSTFCGILKETEGILLRELGNRNWFLLFLNYYINDIIIYFFYQKKEK